jgi:hypothetical protein
LHRSTRNPSRPATAVIFVIGGLAQPVIRWLGSSTVKQTPRASNGAKRISCKGGSLPQEASRNALISALRIEKVALSVFSQA